MAHPCEAVPCSGYLRGSVIFDHVCDSAKCLTSVSLLCCTGKMLSVFKKKLWETHQEQEEGKTLVQPYLNKILQPLEFWVFFPLKLVT